MTAAARSEIIAAERSLPIVTGHTTERSGSCMMVQSLRRCHLISRARRPDTMTIVTLQAFVLIVLRMTEIQAEGPGCLARPIRAARHVTNTT